MIGHPKERSLLVMIAIQNDQKSNRERPGTSSVDVVQKQDPVPNFVSCKHSRSLSPWMKMIRLIKF